MPLAGALGSTSQPSSERRSLLRDLTRARVSPTLAVVVLLAASVVIPSPANAADPPVMAAHVMLDGHARVGSWMAIAVDLQNDGPAVTGELRLDAGAQGRTRYGTPVDLPTNSRQRHVLYAQPPSFGGKVDVALVDGEQTLARQSVPFSVHDSNQLVIGVVAEKPQGITPHIDLLPALNGARSTTVQLGPADLPDRIEGWATLDRLIWQDVDSGRLSNEQVAALRGWIAAGGRLVIVGGTAGLGALSGFPDDILPYRPTATLDVAPEALGGVLGEVPGTASDVPAMAGELERGAALAVSGDRVIAAEAPYGTGAVTVLGFDPSTKWLADSQAGRSLWRRFLPPRSNAALISGDDSQLVQAVQQQPSLALPPIGGLLALLFGYILLIGPINYLVLRRLDRREWAWFTMPVLIGVFALGAYAFGAALRGVDVVINEVAIVRGAPDTSEATAQVYLGVFSPSRGTYQLEVPGGALLSSTLVGDFVGSGDTQSLDILQGDPARIRNLVVGFGSLRTVRAETAAAAPRVHAELRLVDGVLRGTIRNDSDQMLLKPAVVLGNSVAVLTDIGPRAEGSVSLTTGKAGFEGSLSDRIVGQIFFGDPSAGSDSTQRSIVRHAILDQLTIDPNFGASVGLPSESPVLLTWGTNQVVDVRISGQKPRRTGNVLYYIPLSMQIRGRVAFAGDLIRSSVVDTDAGFFNKDPFSINMGRGQATMAFRPIRFDGRLAASKVVFGVNFGGGPIGSSSETRPIEPDRIQPCREDGRDAPDCAKPRPQAGCDPTLEACNGGFQQVPFIEVFDRRGDGRWLRLPEMSVGSAYELKNPERYVDPGSGVVLVRFVNENQDGVGFQFDVRIEGTVE